MSQFLPAAKAIAIPPVFSENSQAEKFTYEDFESGIPNSLRYLHPIFSRSTYLGNFSRVEFHTCDCIIAFWTFNLCEQND